MKRKYSTLGTLIGIGALVLAGCSTDNNANTQAAAEEEYDITVAVTPIADSAAVWLGDEKGFFEEEGLNLNIETVGSGSMLVAGVESESWDFGFSSLLPLMVAADQGLDVRFVTAGAATTGNTEEDVSAVLVKAGSDIKSPKDLEGKRVSVNSLSNIGDTTIRALVEKDGGDPSTIKFTEVGFPDAPAAISNDVADAIWVMEPFRTMAMNDGAEIISHNFAEYNPDMDIAGYFAKGSVVDEKTDLIDRFSRAMRKSSEYAADNPEEVREIVSTYTRTDEEILQNMILPEYRTDFNRDATQRLAEDALKFGTINQELDIDRILPAE